MITCLIRDDGEPNVNRLTYENLWRELKDIPGVELKVVKSWQAAIPKIKNRFVCLVEPDCLVSSGYFNSLLGHMKKSAAELNKLAVLSTATAVNNWAVRFYGYNLDDLVSEEVVPNLTKKKTDRPFYTVQAAYIPGALIKVDFLKELMAQELDWDTNLAKLSVGLSLAFWRKSWMVYLVPGPTYVTTEGYVNDITKYQSSDRAELISKFKKESI